MRRPVAILICLLATLVTPLRATAADCGPATKYVTVWNTGLLPDVQYMCGGQVTILVNRNDNYITFNYQDSLGRAYQAPWIRPGGWVTISGATPLYNIKTYGRYGYSLLPAEIKWGTAPDAY